MFIATWVAHSYQKQLALKLCTLALAKTIHVLGTIEINQFHSRSKRTQRETFVKLSRNQFDLDQVDDTFTVHIGDMPVSVHSKVGARNNALDL